MLMSLPELRASLGIATSEQDDELQRAGEAVTRMMETYIQRPIIVQEVVETFYSPIIFPRYLRAFPVVSLVSVMREGIAQSVGEYRFNPRSGRFWLPGIAALDYDSELEVTYTAGFQTVPEDLRHVFVEGVKITRMQQDRTAAASLPSVDASNGQMVKSISIPDAITLQYDLSGGVQNSAALSAGNVWADTPIGPFTGILDSYKSERAYGSFGG